VRMLEAGDRNPDQTRHD